MTRCTKHGTNIKKFNSCCISFPIIFSLQDLHFNSTNITDWITIDDLIPYQTYKLFASQKASKLQSEDFWSVFESHTFTTKATGITKQMTSSDDTKITKADED